MDILFADASLERLCSQQREQNKQLGAQGARKLRARLADLAAASKVTDLAAGRPHPLVGDRAGQFSLRLDGGRRLVFEPAHEPVPQREDGSTAWDRVTAVRIIFIGDYHD